MNHTNKIGARKTIKFWLLSLKNVDRNSWEKINSGLTELNKSGEFMFNEREIATLEKNKKPHTIYYEDVSEESDFSDIDP